MTAVTENTASGNMQAPTDEQVPALHERLEIAAHAAVVLVRLFNVQHYLHHGAHLDGAEQLDSTDHASVFEHYLNVGIDDNASPSVYIDIDHLRRDLSKHQNRVINPEEAVVPLWLRHGLASIKGVPWFDEEFYLTQYTDLTGKVDNAFLHFATNGLQEHRLPTQYLLAIANQSLSAFPDDSADIAALLSRVPVEFLSAFVSGAYAQEMESLFMAPLYLAQLGCKEDIPASTCLAHFLINGASENIRPSVLFNAEFYKSKVDQSMTVGCGATEVPAAARKYHGLRVSNGVARPVIEEAKSHFFSDKPESIELVSVGGLSPYLHWFLLGREFNIVSTPLFDEEQYCLSHGDAVTTWKAYPFEHYLHHGISDPARRISAYFDAAYYHYRAQTLTEKWPLLDYVLHGQFHGHATAPDFDCRKIDTPQPLLSSAAEQSSMYIYKKIAKLDSGVLADMLARAEAADPTIATPLLNRRLLLAPLRYPEVELNQALGNIITDLPKTQYDSIVLVPQVRMAGSAKIAGKFTEVLASLTGSANVLIVLTDQSNFERPEWFPDNVDVLTLFDYVSREPMDRKVGALFDVVRGLRPKRLININSNVAWHMTSLFGRQLSAWMDMYVYLFCWDINEAGKKQGYPVEWFLPTFDYCKGVFCDSDNLREELWSRFCHTSAQKAKICTLHTPAENRNVNYVEALRHRSGHQGKRRVFWSGRFDRQKRVDLLLNIISAMPEVEFWVWGKPVLNDDSIDLTDIPSNMKMMGAYQSIDDVPISSCDCFLYTAGWDGLPTVLIEVGSRCVPVVASAVGGVTDLINEQSGWPIRDHEDIASYVSAINDVLNDYDAALQKAQLLRQQTLDMCNVESYRATLAAMLTLDVPEVASHE